MKPSSAGGCYLDDEKHQVEEVNLQLYVNSSTLDELSASSRLL